jgi:fructose-1,6-bisphosphatase
MRNEYNHPTVFHPIIDNPDYTTFQVKRAAHLTQQLLDYIDTLYRYAKAQRNTCVSFLTEEMSLFQGCVYLLDLSFLVTTIDRIFQWR